MVIMQIKIVQVNVAVQQNLMNVVYVRAMAQKKILIAMETVLQI